MLSSNTTITAYPERIKKIIAHKKAKIMRQALVAGKKAGERDAALFIADMHHAVKKLGEAKIASIITHAQALIEQQLTNDPHRIIAMVLKILKNVAEHTDVDLCAHPLDAMVIRANMHEIYAQAGSARKICVVEDETFQRGSMLVKANKSIIDAHIKTQIEKAQELLASRLEQKHG